MSKTNRGSGTRLTGLLRDEATGEETPVLALLPARPTGRVVIWLDPAGARGLLDTGAPGSDPVTQPVRELVDGGAIVIGADLFLQGSFLADGSTVNRTRRVGNPREAAAYTFGYNRSVFAQRVQDILRVIHWIESRPAALNVDRPIDQREIALIALQGSGPWAAAARALVPEKIRLAAIDTGAFRFGAVQDLHDPQFLPGGAKYGDLPGMLAVAAPGPLWLRGEGSRAAELPAPIRAAYGASGASIQVDAGDAEGAAARAADWVGRQR